MDGCKFEGNNAMAGGAISIRTGSVATFNGTEFTANISEGHDGKADGDADGGGAIYVGYGTLSLTNTTFTGNSAKEGGAIYNAGTIGLEKVTFENNTANYGGALTSVNAVNCTFKSNYGSQDTSIGGAMYEGTATNCIFTGNYVKQ